MRIIAVVLMLAFGSLASAETQLPPVIDAADPHTEHRARCIGWMMSDYPSGLEETACAAYFALPSAFLFKCARAQKLGYQDATQRRACALFFARASKQAETGYVLN